MGLWHFCFAAKQMPLVCRNWIALLSATNIHIRNAAEKVWPVCMTAENIFAPKLFHPVLINIPKKIVPQSVRMLVLSLVPKTERLITPPAAPLNVLPARLVKTAAASLFALLLTHPLNVLLCAKLPVPTLA